MQNFSINNTKILSNPRNNMSSNTKIYLSNHAKTEEVFKVIQKIMGAEFTQSVSGGRTINKNKPASENNPWTIKFKKNEDNTIKLSTDSYFQFYFLDPVGNTQSTLYFFEGMDSDYSYEQEKYLNPSSSPIWGVLGKRLVDFFGGKVLFNESSDSDNPNNWHVCDHPKFPKRTKNDIGIDNENKRFFLFQNLLFNEPLITSYELKDMEKVTRYWNEEDSHLLSYLKKYEEAKELSESLKTNPNKKIAKKLKV
jgi:hypothetical protein